jgi:hypothetical protein
MPRKIQLRSRVRFELNYKKEINRATEDAEVLRTWQPAAVASVRIS